jgi:hypothetical protein
MTCETKPAVASVQSDYLARGAYLVFVLCPFPSSSQVPQLFGSSKSLQAQSPLHMVHEGAYWVWYAHVFLSPENLGD